MSGVNKCIIVGRLGSDPVVRYTPGGKAVANFSIATDEIYKDKNGERQKKTTWLRIVAWDKLAELAQNFMRKGSQVYVEGPIQFGSFKNKDTGVETPTTEIKALIIQLLGSRADSEVPAGDANEDLAPAGDEESVFG